MIRLVGVVWGKELRDAVRDRRALLSALVFPMFGPLLISLLLSGAARKATAPIEIAVSHAERAPALVSFLSTQNLRFLDAPEDPEAAVRAGEVPAVLVIEPEFADTWRDGRPAPVSLVVDTSRGRAQGTVLAARKALDAYRIEVSAQRLLARGISPQTLQPVLLDEVDLATPSDLAANLLEMIVMFVVLAAFICSMYVAIDTTSGERERRSLEPLLLNPVPRWVLVAGKWLAATSAALLGLLLTLAGLVVSIGQVPLEVVGFRIDLDPLTLATLAFVLLPLALVASSVQLLVAAFASSFREAQTYLSLTLFLPMTPGILLTLDPTDSEGWMYAVPMLSQQVLARDVLRGDALALGPVAVSAITSLTLAGLCVWWTVRLFGRERVLFSR